MLHRPTVHREVLRVHLQWWHRLRVDVISRLLMQLLLVRQLLLLLLLQL